MLSLDPRLSRVWDFSPFLCKYTCSAHSRAFVAVVPRGSLGEQEPRGVNINKYIHTELLLSFLACSNICTLNAIQRRRAIFDGHTLEKVSVVNNNCHQRFYICSMWPIIHVQYGMHLLDDVIAEWCFPVVLQGCRTSFESVKVAGADRYKTDLRHPATTNKVQSRNQIVIRGVLWWP